MLKAMRTPLLLLNSFVEILSSLYEIYFYIELNGSGQVFQNKAVTDIEIAGMLHFTCNFI